MATHLVGLDAESLQGLRAMWGDVAGVWGEHADYLDARASGLTAAMLDAQALSDGDRVLELACGAGGAELAAAERVGSIGAVVLSDVAPEMTEAAARRAAARGATNVCTRVLALESVEEPDAGPLVRLIAAMTDQDRAAVRARLDAEAAPYVTADGVTFPGLSLLASGRRP